MKRILIFCALAGAGSLTCHAQTLEVMAEQLAALRTLQQSTTQGYQIIGDGLDSIGQITNAEYQLHQAYFGSLAVVAPAVSNDAKLAALRDLQKQLIQQINAALAYWKQQLN
jgi:hypothetical protein